MYDACIYCNFKANYLELLVSDPLYNKETTLDYLTTLGNLQSIISALTDFIINLRFCYSFLCIFILYSNSIYMMHHLLSLQVVELYVSCFWSFIINVSIHDIIPFFCYVRPELSNGTYGYDIQQLKAVTFIVFSIYMTCIKFFSVEKATSA